MIVQSLHGLVFAAAVAAAFSSDITAALVHLARVPQLRHISQKQKQHKTNPLLVFRAADLARYTLVMAGGMGFSFNAGYINGACLSGFAHDDGHRQSVAGFTGVYTYAALTSADGNWANAKVQFCMILSFLAGATVIGAIAPRRKAWELVPEYGPAFISQ
jgi:hypothetical protein